jgi:UDPglucose--hexose-1-phosphate uridylyltransferase
MNQSELQSVPHRRLNPLTGEWVLVSPHRTQRPWQGRLEKLSIEQPPEYDPGCYLCPGNERAGGARNPHYSTVFVFDNDYPALLPEIPDNVVGRSGGQSDDQSDDQSGLIASHSEHGICRVVCFSPRHDLTIARMNLNEIRQVVDIWVEQYRSLRALPWINHVQIFENRGAAMGASNPHPHCQIWATASLPNVAAKEGAALQNHCDRRHSCLLCDYLKLELAERTRVVCQNDQFIILVPHWAVWPFETLLLSKRHLGAIDQLSIEERDGLADILQRLSRRYDNIFEASFPYSMGFHQSPADHQPHPEWHFHAHYYPPLLRSATVQKFMVGYEMLATPQRDTTPESAAARLREVGELHFMDKSSPI